MRVPVIAPAGTATRIFSVAGARPSPRQSGHALIARPEPPQREHAVSREPGACPVPLQVAHETIRVTLIFAFTPRRDSSKLIEIGYSRSCPRSGFRRFWRAETCEKISLKSASRDLEKSKPRKLNPQFDPVPRCSR